MIIDKPRKIILSTVPIAMFFYLFMLNHFFGQIENSNKDTIVNNANDDSFLNFNNNLNKIDFSKQYRKLTVKKYSPPSPHCFVNDDLSDFVKAEEEAKTLGVIIK